MLSLLRGIGIESSRVKTTKGKLMRVGEMETCSPVGIVLGQNVLSQGNDASHLLTRDRASDQKTRNANDQMRW